jgi:hypothetical protein
MMQVFGGKLVRMPMVKMKTDGGGEGRSEKEAAVAKGKGLVEGLVMKTNGKMEVEELPSPEQLKGAKGRMITLRMPNKT